MNTVVPLNDLREHKDFETTCECNPRVEWINGEMLIIHNAFDQREIIEKVNEILKDDESESS